MRYVIFVILLLPSFCFAGWPGEKSEVVMTYGEPKTESSGRLRNIVIIDSLGNISGDEKTLTSPGQEFWFVYEVESWYCESDVWEMQSSYKGSSQTTIHTTTTRPSGSCNVCAVKKGQEVAADGVMADGRYKTVFCYDGCESSATGIGTYRPETNQTWWLSAQYTGNDCGNIGDSGGTSPETPTEPSGPGEPETPTEPPEPGEPETPIEPPEPNPETPTEPGEPTVEPPGTTQPGEPSSGTEQWLEQIRQGNSQIANQIAQNNNNLNHIANNQGVINETIQNLQGSGQASAENSSAIVRNTNRIANNTNATASNTASIVGQINRVNENLNANAMNTSSMVGQLNGISNGINDGTGQIVAGLNAVEQAIEEMGESEEGQGVEGTEPVITGNTYDSEFDQPVEEDLGSTVTDFITNGIPLYSFVTGTRVTLSGVDPVLSKDIGFTTLSFDLAPHKGIFNMIGVILVALSTIGGFLIVIARVKG